jgi:hypothetical protein
LLPDTCGVDCAVVRTHRSQNNEGNDDQDTTAPARFELRIFELNARTTMAHFALAAKQLLPWAAEFRVVRVADYRSGLVRASVGTGPQGGSPGDEPPALPSEGPPRGSSRPGGSAEGGVAEDTGRSPERGAAGLFGAESAVVPLTDPVGAAMWCAVVVR